VRNGGPYPDHIPYRDTSGRAKRALTENGELLVPAVACVGGGQVAKYHSRPSAQYRYEHYDPRF